MAVHRDGAEVVTDVYDDSERPRRTVREIPWDDLEKVRDNELALVRQPRDDSVHRAFPIDDSYGRNVRRSERRPDEDYLPDYPPARRRYKDENDYAISRYSDRNKVSSSPNQNRSLSVSKDRSNGVASRRDASPGDGSDDGDGDVSHGRQHRRRRPRRNRSADACDKDNEEGRLWYSMKSRRDCSMLERNFDSSYDGIIAAAAGAALGAMTVRNFAGQESRGKKIIGAALLGAASFNVAENHCRVYLEEKTERKEENWEEKWGKRN